MNSKCHFCGTESDGRVSGARVGTKWVCDSCVKDLAIALREHIEKIHKERNEIDRYS